MVNHSNSDCIAFIIMTHGEEGDILHAKDRSYKLDDMICNKLTADKCPSLAGKPKLFFIQACKGKKYDPGSTLLSTDSPHASDSYRQHFEYTIPNEADFFIAFSSAPGVHKMRFFFENQYSDYICYRIFFLPK
jgi:caspase 7